MRNRQTYSINVGYIYVTPNYSTRRVKYFVKKVITEAKKLENFIFKFNIAKISLKLYFTFNKQQIKVVCVTKDIGVFIHHSSVVRPKYKNDILKNLNRLHLTAQPTDQRELKP